MKRLSAIDAFRGLAVVLMVMHHTVDSWVEPVARGTYFFTILRHLGGIPAPAFMILAGLSSALVAAREREKGAALGARILSGVKRGLYILGVAFAFRVFCFVAGGNRLEYWPILFRVDVLNCMGVSLALVSAACSFARTTRQSIAIALGFAALFGLAAPLMESVHVTFPSELIGNYLTGHSVMVLFPMFPWVAYLAVGYAAGESIAASLRISKDPGSITLARATRPYFLVAAILFSLGWALELLPFRLYPRHDYWHSSPLWFLMRIGIQFALLAAFAAWLRNDVKGVRAKFLQLLGRHSLLAYVFHIELVYGRLSNPVSKAVSIPVTFLAVAGLVAVCGALAWATEWWEGRRRRGVESKQRIETAAPTVSLDPTGV
jgi:uncharacterized membrane protein